MNKYSSIKSAGSLLERASEVYDFGASLRSPAKPQQPAEAKPVEAKDEKSAEVETKAAPQPKVEAQPKTAKEASRPATRSVAAPLPSKPIVAPGQVVSIDRQMLTDNNFIDPDGPVTGLSEEFRIVKRQLLLSARGGKGYDMVEHGERILVCSAHPNEGKTYCAVNLALSMAKEKDNRVLLVDADFAKPSVLQTMGIEHAPGFMDALRNPDIDAEDLIIQTDINGLSILPAGEQTNQDTEYLASSRTAAIIDQLTRNDPSRIIIFDSPPALAASPASVLALHVGQCLLVVEADDTTDSALRDALNLLSGCEDIQLLLNRAKFSPTGRKFGSYYGYGA